jgi:hypothetical protein
VWWQAIGLDPAALEHVLKKAPSEAFTALCLRLFAGGESGRAAVLLGSRTTRNRSDAVPVCSRPMQNRPMRAALRVYSGMGLGGCGELLLPGIAALPQRESVLAWSLRGMVHVGR